MSNMHSRTGNVLDMRCVAHGERRCSVCFPTTPRRFSLLGYMAFAGLLLLVMVLYAGVRATH